MKINGAVLSYLTFSDECVHIDVSPHIDSLESRAVVVVGVEYGDSLELIIMVLDAISRINHGHIRLWFNYLPYARQDRVCAPGQAADPQQLSGLGFSSTQRGELMCRVSSKFTRNIRIIF